VWPDSRRVSARIGPPAGRRPPGGPILALTRLESDENPVRKHHFSERFLEIRSFRGCTLGGTLSRKGYFREKALVFDYWRREGAPPMVSARRPWSSMKKRPLVYLAGPCHVPGAVLGAALAGDPKFVLKLFSGRIGLSPPRPPGGGGCRPPNPLRRGFTRAMSEQICDRLQRLFTLTCGVLLAWEAPAPQTPRVGGLPPSKRLAQGVRGAAAQPTRGGGWGAGAPPGQLSPAGRREKTSSPTYK